MRRSDTYRKKPVEIRAWRVADLNRAAVTDWDAVPACIREAYTQGGWVFGAERGIFVPTLEGSLFADRDDWIIQGVKGEFYPCKPDIFAATYDKVGWVTTHTPFRTEGELAVRCNCGWHTTSRRQSTATAAAKRHVDMYPDHEVTTVRVQAKLTFRRSR